MAIRGDFAFSLKCGKNRVVALATSFVLLSATGSLRAFDTGHHWELTSQVMREMGFNDEARQTTCVSNWMLDYYSSSPTGSKQVREDLSKLHCDNLYDAAMGRDYLATFNANSKAALIEAATGAASDREVLMLLGAVLHVVQDTYSHSNWPEYFIGANALSNYTWYGANGRLPASFLTGSYNPHDYIGRKVPCRHPEHGSYDGGLHKDAHDRAYWAQAYFLAYCASREFMESFRTWLPAERWESLKNTKLLPGASWELQGDIRAAFGISLWIDVAGEHGHWKGGQSGHKALFVKSAISFLARSSRNARWYRMGHGYSPLLPGLYEAKAPAVKRSDIPPGLALKRTTVFLRVAGLRELGRPFDRGVAGKSDFYLNGAVYYGTPVPKKTAGPLPMGLRPVTEPDPAWEGDLLEVFRDRVVQEAAELTSPWRVLAIADDARLANSGGILTFVLQVGEEDFGPDDMAPLTPGHEKGRDKLHSGLVLQYDAKNKRVIFPESGESFSAGRGRLITPKASPSRGVEMSLEVYEMPVKGS